MTDANVSIKRFHRMPFGAQVQDDGAVRFRIWAPSALNVKLSLETPHGSPLQPMQQAEDGFFELITNRVRPGDLYRYIIDDRLRVPDPASRRNPYDVDGPSQVIDPGQFMWTDLEWKGRPWQEAAIYELHTGAFSPEGTFKGVRRQLDYLAQLGVSAIELMPVADFPGLRNWGYDGVLPFAPDSTYGHPGDLKNLVQSCHETGLMIILDVVYNHFGPEGNYLYSYAREFFTDRYHTPWGNAINFEGAGSRTVRDFFIHNALYWLEEFHFDGLRLDAVHEIIDHSQPGIMEELAESIRNGPGRERHCHLILENVNNDAGLLARNDSGISVRYDAQWNDDWHHSMHVALTGEHDGYYADYADKPIWYLGRCLTQGFAYQGEISKFHGGTGRGEPSAKLPLTSFVSFLQNHDQIGNRAFGERISGLTEARAREAAIAILLLSPSPPMLFMGEEVASQKPFLFFCDFGGDLAKAVTTGRRSEFARFRQFATPESQARIPDPVDPATFQKSKLDWEEINSECLNLYQRLLEIRKERVMPFLSQLPVKASFQIIGDRGLVVTWILTQGATLHLTANLGVDDIENISFPPGEVLYSTNSDSKNLKGWSVVWTLE
jgi:maltooligosyltrehalose trehalohydrolase